METENNDKYKIEIVCTADGPWYVTFRIPDKSGKGVHYYLPTHKRAPGSFCWIKVNRIWTPEDCPKSYVEDSVQVYKFENKPGEDRFMQEDVLAAWVGLYEHVSKYLQSINIGQQALPITSKIVLHYSRNRKDCCGMCGRKYRTQTSKPTATGVCGECAADIFAKTGKLVTA